MKRYFTAKILLFNGLISLILLILSLFINIIYISNKLNEQFYSGVGYIQYLSKFHYTDDILTRLIEFNQSLFEYEKKNTDNISAEIWQCFICDINNLPTWNMADLEIIEDRSKILKANNLNRNQFIHFNKYLYIAIVFNINNNIYKTVLYKKVFYFQKDLEFINSFITIYFIIFIIFFFLFTFPIELYKSYLNRKISYKIRLNTINQISNLMKHSLKNQESVLNSIEKSDKIEKALHYNYDVVNLLEETYVIEINPLEFIIKFDFSAYKLKSIRIKIKTFNAMFYIEKNLIQALTLILDNATHFSVSANCIVIEIYQNFRNGKIFLEISNDGIPIPKDFQKKLFLNKFTNKKDGNGIGLLNLKQLLKKTKADINLIKSNPTTFRICLPIQKNSKLLINKEFDICLNTKEKSDINYSYNFKNKPLVIIIDDEPSILEDWSQTLFDVELYKFNSPTAFISFLLKNESMLDKINVIISDFSFGEYNLIESDILNDLEIFDIKFKGYFVISSGYSKNHLESLLPEKYMNIISLIIDKKPITYKELLNKINLFSLSNL